MMSRVAFLMSGVVYCAVISHVFPRGEAQEAVTIVQSVIEGTSLTINCSSLTKTPSMHVWWLNDTIIFARGIHPAELDIYNIKGTFVNSTLSYIHFDGFSSANAGKYECTKRGETIVSYVLEIREMNDSPNLVTLSILKNSSITINCSSSTNSSMTHVWWFNGIIIFANSFQPTEIGISNVQGTYVNSSFSYLRFDGFSQINTGNYTCRDGNTVNKFFMLDIKVPEDNQGLTTTAGNENRRQVTDLKEFILSNITITSIAGSAILLALLCCIVVVAKRFKTPFHNMRRSLRLPSTATDGKDSVTENDSSSEYDKPGITFFSYKDICLHEMVPSSPGILRFQGSLRNCNRKGTNALVSCLANSDNPLQKRMWRNYVDAVLRFEGHDNLLEIIGLCKESGEIFVLQSYNETTLKLYLLSLFHRSEDISTLMQRSFSQLAYDVIKGVEFLSSNGCFHPGLSTEKVVVNCNYVCKLYDFCSHEDVETFTDVNFPKGQRMLMISLAPEFLVSGEYTSACDMWSLGITLWEVFCAGEEVSKEPDVEFLRKFRSGIVKLSRPKHCAQKLFDTLELCWSPRGSDRPNMSDLRLKLRESLSMLEYTDISCQVEGGICMDMGNDKTYTPCARHVYQVLEANVE